MYILMRVLCFVGVLAWSSALAAEEFPNRSIKFVVPFPAGGPSDFISRVLTEKMASLLGQSIGIENHAGAGGLRPSSLHLGHVHGVAPDQKLLLSR
jgi:tripartite-type tricarboxylate transporter receptor subunit TctC